MKTPVRERILDAAVKLLETSGVSKLAQPQVAKEAGVPPGHLTYYFPKRLDLLSAVASRFVTMLREDVPSLFGVQELDDAMRAKALGFVARLTKNRARTRMLLGLIVAAEEDPELREQVAENVQLMRGLIARVLRCSEKDRDVDVVLAGFLGIALQHLVLEGRQSDGETDAVIARFEEWMRASAATRAKKPRDKPAADKGGSREAKAQGGATTGTPKGAGKKAKADDSSPKLRRKGR
ncbi:MAG: TetR/AcrR family transcriptional regulator [Myxococcales bacterium]|nr:TetR/AcrR family transcriptional regulator [Myxococcales bacterium]